MITFSRLGKKGNLGNQLFQIASTIGIAKFNGHPYAFPYWRYSQFFKNKLPLLDSQIQFKNLNEKGFEYFEYRLGDNNYDLNGWFQSEKYFDIGLVKEQFNFKKGLTVRLKLKYGHLLDSKHILISVRRGDFVNHPYYFKLTYKYYFLAVTACFPDWKSRNLIFTSDDIDYCKRHFSLFDNAYFLDDLDAVEQLAFGSLCNDFIISNSTFSWWLAWLGEKSNSSIIRPNKNFRGDFAILNNDKDYFPERWIAFQIINKHISFKYFNLLCIGEYFRILNYFKFQIKKLKKFSKNLIKKAINYSNEKV